MPSSSSSSGTSDPSLSRIATTLERRRRLADVLRRLSADALVVAGLSSRDADLAALVGPVHLGESFVLATADGAVHLGYATEMERDEATSSGIDLLNPTDLGIAELRRQRITGGEALARTWLGGLECLGLGSGTVAIAGTLRAGEVAQAVSHLADAGWTVVGADSELRRLRKRKTDWEISEARRSAAGVCAAFRTAASVLARVSIEGDVALADGRPLTCGDLRAAIDRELGARGLGQPEGNIVTFGGDAAVPHTQGRSDQELRVGQSIVIDLYPKGHLFADCTRTFCLGAAPASLQHSHQLVLDALERAATMALPRVRASELQTAVCDLFESRGYDTPRSNPGLTSGYVHGLGHGVGFELHELPDFRPGDDDSERLAAGDLFTLEPGLYDPSAESGVRLEDLYLMGEIRAELLTPLPYDLDPRLW